MSKVGFAVRWGTVFSLLGFFTLYSVSALGMGSQGKAYADAISSNMSFRGDNDFVVMSTDQGGGQGDNDNEDNHHHGNKRMICAIDQDQLNALRAAYSTAVFTSTDVHGEQKGIVEVDKTPGVTKHDIYETIGLDTHGPKCQIITIPQSFLLFLLPGVS